LPIEVELPGMTSLIYAILFVFGLAVGSFLNVVIFRYKPGEKVLAAKAIGGPGNWGERSRCRDCGKTLSWFELIPLASFLAQKGKCRGCGGSLSFQYFLVELLSGLVFVFVPMFWAVSLPLLRLPEYISMFVWLSAIWILIFLIFIVISAIDFRHFVIPDSLNLALAALGIILIAVNNYYKRFNMVSGSFVGSDAAIFGFRDNIWFNYFGAAVLAMAFFGLLIFLSRGKGMGWGDFKLVGALGLIFGWPDAILAIALGFIIGAVVGTVLLVFNKKKMKDAIPFGPFLAFGSVLIFFFGYQMLEFYFKFFNGLLS